MKDVIIIDGSYYCFYRYYAILNWFKVRKMKIYPILWKIPNLLKNLKLLL